MAKNKNFFKRILIDLVGTALVVLSLLIGWLPGPGGIPLFLAGLALLATNHHWAKKWLRHLRRHSNNLSEMIFRDHVLVKLAYDILALGLIAMVVYFFGRITHSFLRGALIWVGLISVVVLILNRRRGQRFGSFIKRSLIHSR